MSPRHAPQRTAAALVSAAVLLPGLLLAGCSEAAVDWDSIGQTVQQGVDKARGTVDEITATAADAGLDQSTLTQVKDVTGSAGDAISQARAALDGASEAGETASTAIAEAQSALQDAKDKVDELSGTVGEPLASALASLADQLAALAGELDGAR